MNWLDAMNNAVEYFEENITEKRNTSRNLGYI